MGQGAWLVRRHLGKPPYALAQLGSISQVPLHSCWAGSSLLKPLQTAGVSEIHQGGPYFQQMANNTKWAAQASAARLWCR